MEKISKSEAAYFLHRIVSAMQDLASDKAKRQEIGLIHDQIYMMLEKPSP